MNQLKMKILLIALSIVTTYGEIFQNINNKFTADVYKELLKSNSGNFLICPISAEIVMALVRTGSKGETAEQLSNALYLPQEVSKVQDIFLNLTPKLKIHESYLFSSANKMYLKNSFNIIEEFKSTAVNAFGTDIQNIDFDKKSESVSEINRWVEQKTHKKIQNLITEEHIDDTTLAILINALYFKANWRKPFDPNWTTKSKFYINKKDHVEVEMMNIRVHSNVFESNNLNAKFVEIPFESDDVTMTFVLPNDRDGLSNLETRISEVLITPAYEKSDSFLWIPKFKIESSIDFKKVLQALGVTTAFSTAADFTGISDSFPSLYISNVVQKSFLEINEKGATAAASTAAYINFVSAPRYFIRVDHPFIFFLKHKVTGIFFIGRFLQPH